MSTQGRDPAQASPRLVAKAIAFLILAGLLAYCNSFSKTFHFDDLGWITTRSSYQHDDIWQFRSSMMQNRPILDITLYLNYQAGGANPFGYHLVNIAIHIAAALALFGLVRRTLLLPRWQGRFTDSAPMLALAAAWLWLVHPLQTQAVTYIIQRGESLMGLCFLLTLYCMLRGTQAAHPWRWYAAACCICVIGAGAKEVMVMAVPIMVCYDRIFIASRKEMVRQRWYLYLALGAIFILPVLLAVLALLTAMPGTDASAGFGMAGLGASVYWMTQAEVIAHYLRLCFVPYPQCFYYGGWPIVSTLADCWPQALLVGFLLLATIALLVRRHWLGFLGLWFFGILAPTSLIPLVDVAFEHRLYLSLAAVCVLVVIAGHWAGGWLHGANLQPFLASLLVLAGTALTVLTLLRNEDYRSRVDLWLSAAEFYPDNMQILRGIADAYEEDGDLENAAVYHAKCTAKAPALTQFQFRHAVALRRLDQETEGDEAIPQSWRLPKSQGHLHDYFGSLYDDFARAHYLQGNLPLAEEYCHKASGFAPRKASPHSALALILSEQGRADKAWVHRGRALEVEPDWPKTARTLAYKWLHRCPVSSPWTRKEALFYARQAAMTTDYQDPAMLDLLAEACAANGMHEQAQQFAQQVGGLRAQEQLARALAYYQQHPPSARGQ